MMNEWSFVLNEIERILDVAEAEHAIAEAEAEGFDKLMTLEQLLDKLGLPCDQYERMHLDMCADDPTNDKLLRLTHKHLMARRKNIGS
jgi:hypothetical protein